MCVFVCTKIIGRKCPFIACHEYRFLYQDNVTCRTKRNKRNEKPQSKMGAKVFTCTVNFWAVRKEQKIALNCLDNFDLIYVSLDVKFTIS